MSISTNLFKGYNPYANATRPATGIPVYGQNQVMTQSADTPEAPTDLYQGTQTGLGGFFYHQFSLYGGSIVTSVKTHEQSANALRSFKTDGINVGLQSLGISSLHSAGYGAAVTGVLSGAKNLISASKGNISMAAATGNIVSDTLNGAVVGTMTGLTAGVTSMALRSIGMTGLALSIGTALIAPTFGTRLGNMIYNVSTRDKVASGIAKMIGGNPTAPAPEAP